MLNSSVRIPQNDKDFLLSKLWAGGKYGNIWTNATKESKWFELSQGIEKVEIPAEWKDYNVYFGVHPSSKVGYAKTRTTIEDIHVINALYAEFDDKDFQDDIQAVGDHIWGLDPLPSIQVLSGGGYHCYWLLEDPLHIETDEDRIHAQTLQTAWVAYVGGDRGAHDLARVLRIPGTQNHKYDPPRDVRIINKSNTRHSLAELTELMLDEIEAVQAAEGRSKPDKMLPKAIERPEKTGKIQIKTATPGDRNNSLITYGGALIARRFNHWQTEQLVRYKNSQFEPPLPPSEIEEVLRSIRKFEASDKAAQPTAEDYVDVCAALGYEFKLNIMNDILYVNDERITDIVESRIKADLRDFGFFQVQHAIDAYTGMAPEWHPIREYLENLEWDGEDHIAKLMSYFKDERDHLGWMFHKWALGAVRKVYETGHQNVVLVLDGAQRMGKSYFVRWLGTRAGNEYFHEAGANPENKDDRLRLITIWVWELSELGSTTRRSDVDALKHFLTREYVTERKAYGRHDIFKPATVSFIATVNDQGFGFLSDPTGSRRFATVTVQDIDHAYATEVDPDQVWAQAVAEYKAGADPDFDSSQMEQAAMANKDYEVGNPIHDVLDELILLDGDEDEDFLSSKDLTQRVKDTGLTNSSNEIAKQISVWMQKHGISKRRRYLASKGKQVRGYWGVKIVPTMALNLHLEQ